MMMYLHTKVKAAASVNPNGQQQQQAVDNKML